MYSSTGEVFKRLTQSQILPELLQEAWSPARTTDSNEARSDFITRTIICHHNVCVRDAFIKKQKKRKSKNRMDSNKHTCWAVNTNQEQQRFISLSVVHHREVCIITSLGAVTSDPSSHCWAQRTSHQEVFRLKLWQLVSNKTNFLEEDGVDGWVKQAQDFNFTEWSYWNVLPVKEFSLFRWKVFGFRFFRCRHNKTDMKESAQRTTVFVASLLPSLH